MITRYVMCATTIPLTSDNHTEKAVSFNLLDFSMVMLKMNDAGLNECQWCFERSQPFYKGQIRKAAIIFIRHLTSKPFPVRKLDISSARKYA